MKSITTFLVTGVLALVRFSALGQSQTYYLSVDDVKGEATDAGHKDQIMVLEFNLSATNSGYANGAGRAKFEDLVIRKPVDKSSPILCQAAGSGIPYKKVVLYAADVVKGEQKDLYIITLEDCHVKGFSTSGASTGNTLSYPYPFTETVAFSYGKVRWEYGSTKAGRDLAANKNLVLTPSNSGSNAPVQTTQATVAVAPLAVTQKPVTLNVNVVRKDAGNVSLSFEAEAGKVYHILGSATAVGPFDYLQTYPANETKAVALTLSATQATQFFRVEEAQ